MKSNKIELNKRENENNVVNDLKTFELNFSHANETIVKVNKVNGINDINPYEYEDS